MYRRNFLRAGARVLGLSLAAPLINRGSHQLFAGTTARYSTRTVDLVQGSIVLDMLGLLTLDWNKLQRWHAAPGAFSDADLTRLRDSGINAFHPAVKLNLPRPREAAERHMLDWVSFLAARPDCFVRVNTAADIQQAQANGKIAVILGMQNSDHFGCCDDVARFHGLGQRISQLTYNSRNPLGHGCLTHPDDGLTAFGASVISSMNDCGMAVDLSHCSERTTIDAIEASRKPVLITHSNCRSLCAHPRCKSDETIRRMAARGSVMGITSVRSFISHRDPATINDLLDHFDHIARTVGVEHVGIGSDTDPGGGGRSYQVAGMDRCRRVYDLTEGLVQRGYSDSDIRLILGGNFLRALSSIWLG